ncbi:MAG TPA: hypothetical protein VN132_04880, partial [Bdellovibrio sp.]|nr:hypothetical protein [Bdellovibrio sp.]
KLPPVIVKKVKPYPFPAELVLGAQKSPVEVIYLGQGGLIAKLKNQILHVGQYHQIAFDLPVGREHFELKVRVLKTYDKSTDPKRPVVERMAEFHFQTLTKDQHKSIVAFLAAIGQVK